MEVSSLGLAYAKWIRDGVERFRAWESLDVLEVALVGCSAMEAAGIASAMAGHLKHGVLRVKLMCPLGCPGNTYKWCWSAGDSVGAPEAAAELARKCEGLGVTPQVTASTENSLGALADGALDVVVFGPVAFGIVDGGAGAADAAKRASIVQVALSKTKRDSGCVLLCSREATEWQRELFSDDWPVVHLEPVFSSEPSLEGGGKLHLSASARVSSSLSAGELELSDLLCVQSLGKVEATSDKIAQAREVVAKYGSATLPEASTLYMVSRSPQAAGALLQEGQGAEAGFQGEDPAAWWPNGREDEFFNCGFDLWSRQRAAWRDARGEPASSDTGPVPYEEVIAGLASLRRTFELPQPIRLGDLIEIYLDIWESQDGY